MENKQLILYGETIAVYCDTHTKSKLYGNNEFLGGAGGCLNLVVYAAINGF
jgi:hypothetical protein